MWSTILWATGLTILFGGILVIPILYELKRRKTRWLDDEGDWSHSAQVRGAFAPTPKPEWVDWGDEEDTDDPPRTTA